MKRLTHKEEDWYWKNEEFWISAENPSLEKIDNVYYKLAEFEDFMEEQGFESLEQLKEKVDFRKRIDTAPIEKAFREKQKIQDRWNNLKEWIKEQSNPINNLVISDDETKYLYMSDILDLMQELEKE